MRSNEAKARADEAVVEARADKTMAETAMKAAAVEAAAVEPAAATLSRSGD